jgi:hypothetical protein
MWAGFAHDEIVTALVLIPLTQILPARFLRAREYTNFDKGFIYFFQCGSTGASARAAVLFHRPRRQPVSAR